MFGTLLIGLLINYVIFTIWLWISRELFGSVSNTRLMWSMIISAVIVGVLRVASHDDILAYISLDVYQFLLIVITVSMFLLNIFHRFVDHKNKISYSMRSIWWIVCIAWVQYLLPASELIVILLFLAMIEEFLKHSGSISLQRDDTYPTTLIGIAIVVALWFAWRENIVFISDQSQNIVWLALWRWFTWFIAHSIFGGIIAAIIARAKQHHYTGIKLFGMMIVALLAGTLVHLLYNYSLQLWYVLVFVIFVLWGYIWLSYLLRRTDRLYIDT